MPGVSVNSVLDTVVVLSVIYWWKLKGDRTELKGEEI